MAMSTSSPILPFEEERPWGKYIEFTRNISSTVKILEIEAGESLSLQSHHLRVEFWYIIDGIGEMTVGDSIEKKQKGDTCFIDKEIHHRIHAISPLRILEIATGYGDERDITRYEDAYGRTVMNLEHI